MWHGLHRGRRGALCRRRPVAASQNAAHSSCLPVSATRQPQAPTTSPPGDAATSAALMRCPSGETRRSNSRSPERVLQMPMARAPTAKRRSCGGSSSLASPRRSRSKRGRPWPQMATPPTVVAAMVSPATETATRTRTSSCAGTGRSKAPAAMSQMARPSALAVTSFRPQGDSSRPSTAPCGCESASRALPLARSQTAAARGSVEDTAVAMVSPPGRARTRRWPTARLCSKAPEPKLQIEARPLEDNITRRSPSWKICRS
mmetsp:Transcript_106202/g.297319  ORF Transcript_106202/g.297319 Transcript_106202/m.297319 type:complete len:260 (-) Transcript_106202:178-957(-)